MKGIDQIMSLKYTMEVLEFLDDPTINGKKVVDLFNNFPNCQADYKTVDGTNGATDFVKILIKGSEGKAKGGEAKTLGIIGQLGGIGARPNRIGFVSDGDGAAAALAIAKKLAVMSKKGDVLPGDVMITTHICPNAPTIPHDPVEFMGAPLDICVMNKHQVFSEMDAILSIDTTKGNKLFNHKGIAISPTVKSGYILKFSQDLIHLLEITTGDLPRTFAVTTQDITPYGNGIYHMNSILQPSTATDAPVVGVAITAKSVVPGSSTGASDEVDIAKAVRYGIECAKQFTLGKLHFYDVSEFNELQKLYGSMKHIQTQGNK